MVGRRLHWKYTHATARGAFLRGDSGIPAARAIALAGLVFVTVSPTFGGAATLLGGAQAPGGALGLCGEVGAELELEGGVLDGAGSDGDGFELGEL